MVCNMHLYLTELNNQIVLFLKLSDLEQKLEETALTLLSLYTVKNNFCSIDFRDYYLFIYLIYFHNLSLFTRIKYLSV